MKLYVWFIGLGSLLGAFAGGYSELTRTSAGAGTTEYAFTSAFIFGIIGAIVSAFAALLIRLLLSSPEK